MNPTLTARVAKTLSDIREERNLTPDWRGHPGQTLAELQPIPERLMRNVARLHGITGQPTEYQRLDITLGILSSLGISGFAPRKLAKVATVREATILELERNALDRAFLHHRRDLAPLLGRVTTTLQRSATPTSQD